MLPLADNLERALTHTSGKETEAGLRQGVEITLNAFADALAKNGIRVIQAQGQPFDPEWHEAVGVIPHSMLSPSTVVRVEQKGYTFHDRLLRPARVWIASG
jgi:molecular chaperone GrpE